MGIPRAKLPHALKLVQILSVTSASGGVYLRCHVVYAGNRVGDGDCGAAIPRRASSFPRLLINVLLGFW
jgi:hypothetical protein